MTHGNNKYISNQNLNQMSPAGTEENERYPDYLACAVRTVLITLCRYNLLHLFYVNLFNFQIYYNR